MDARADSTTASGEDRTVFAVLIALSVSHLLNDTIQSLITAIYPILRDSFDLDYGQVGLLTFTFQVTASLLQPFVGIFTDRRPQPYALPIGMGASFLGLILLAVAPTFGVLLVAAGFVGLGSSVFHPESSRIARLASGGQHGFAQSIFQVGGNAGTAIGPLLAAAIIVPHGQRSVAWLSIVAALAMVVLWRVSLWYRKHHFTAARKPKPMRAIARPAVSNARIIGALAVIVALAFSKFFYLESFRSYYTFFLIDHYGLSIPVAQVLLFVFLFSFAAGTLVGGIIGDRFGRKLVIWWSILGILPFTLALPHVNLIWTVILTVPIGFGLASAFPAILVYAQDLVPGRTGLVSGTLFGVAFGMGGIGAAALGKLADLTSIEFVYQLCAYLPAIGLLTAFLPNVEKPHRARKSPATP